MKVYLAGPTVFNIRAIELAEQKKEILLKLGMKGLYPLDNEVDFDAYDDVSEAGFAIGEGNLKMMDEADTIIADLTPFNGPSADTGTIGELYYMFANGKPINGYSNDARPFDKRLIEDFYDNDVYTDESGYVRGRKDDMFIERMGFFDNLMHATIFKLTKGVFVSGEVPEEDYYTDLRHFEAVAQAIAPQ